jgi:hypothetical protein
MLKYAQYVAEEEPEPENKEGSVAASLAAASEMDDGLEAMEKIGDAVETLFADAGVSGERFSAGGNPYSVEQNSVDEFVRWYNMPWD